MRIYLTFFLNLTLLGVWAQTKTEFEKRIPSDSFPLAAQTLLRKLPDDTRKLRCFKELSNDHTSYEVKLLYNGKHYSIEFNKDGYLEDIEIDVKRKAMSLPIEKKLDTYFKDSYKKYRWLKIQEQYNYQSEESPLDFVLRIMQGETHRSPFYEIVAEVKKNRSFVLKEYNFDSQGNKLAERDIDPESYAHVLY